MNKANFARLAGVGRAAITLGVKRGLVVQTADGMIDAQDPVNVAYIKAHREPKPKQPAAPKAPKPAVKAPAAKAPRERPPRKPKTERPPKADAVPPPPPLGDDLAGLLPDELEAMEDMGQLTVEKMRAEINYKREAAEAYRIKRLSSLGVLVEREHVRQTLGRFNAELRIRLLELPGTIAPRLAAMARAGSTDTELAALLEDEVARAIDGAKAVIRRAHLEAAV